MSVVDPVASGSTAELIEVPPENPARALIPPPTADVEGILSTLSIRRVGEDLDLVRRAHAFATKAHEGQRRLSGEPYITHPVAVATIIADLGLDTVSAAAALLHDAVEDTGASLAQIEAEFGPAVAAIVDGVTKLDRLRFDSKEAQQAATMRKMLVAMARDWRVLVIKLADRLHNMRTLSVMPEWKQHRTAEETRDIYAPLAHRLGIQEVKWQLEDLAFETLHPKRFGEIAQMVATRAPRREVELAEVLAVVRSRLAEAGIEAEVTGRPKNLWSIYEKMVVRGKEFDEIHDLVAIRVIVTAEKDCWASLGAVHALWPPVQGRFKDYINSPKFNLYQSLHTTVVGPHVKPLEIQIRTQEMHRRAEHGIAAHWGYKEGSSAKTPSKPGVQRGARSTDEIEWLQRIVDWERDTPDPVEFLETLKVDLEQDEVYVFTPKGQIITLPAGATPVDFAYAIHTEVGHRCVGARVNGRLLPLDSKLHSGDTVEVVTSKIASAGPSRDWLQLVTSPRARNKIRQWFSRERRGGRHRDRSGGAGAVAPASRPADPEAPELACALGRGDIDGLWRPRLPACGARRRPRLGPGARAAPRAGASRRGWRGAAAHDRVAASAAEPSPRLGRHLRRGTRRRDGPPLALLHPGTGRSGDRVRHARPWRLGSPRGLRERDRPRGRRQGAPDRGGVGRGPQRRLRCRHRGEGARPQPAAG